MDGDTNRNQPRRASAEPDVAQYCPSCGRPGSWRKCKLLCENPRCGVHIILACVD